MSAEHIFEQTPENSLELVILTPEVNFHLQRLFEGLHLRAHIDRSKLWYFPTSELANFIDRPLAKKLADNFILSEIRALQDEGFPQMVTETLSMFRKITE